MAQSFILNVQGLLQNSGKTRTLFTWPDVLSDLSATGKDVIFAPDEGWNTLIECAITTGDDIDISNFATVSCLCVENTDGTNFVSVTHDNAAGATVVTKVLAGQVYITPDCDPSATFNITADTAVCVCNVAVVGS